MGRENRCQIGVGVKQVPDAGEDDTGVRKVYLVKAGVHLTFILIEIY